MSILPPPHVADCSVLWYCKVRMPAAHRVSAGSSVGTSAGKRFRWKSAASASRWATAEAESGRVIENEWTRCNNLFGRARSASRQRLAERKRCTVACRMLHAFMFYGVCCSCTDFMHSHLVVCPSVRGQLR